MICVVYLLGLSVQCSHDVAAIAHYEHQSSVVRLEGGIALVIVY